MPALVIAISVQSGQIRTQPGWHFYVARQKANSPSLVCIRFAHFSQITWRDLRDLTVSRLHSVCSFSPDYLALS
jgi:hypothetical protein